MVVRFFIFLLPQIVWMSLEAQILSGARAFGMAGSLTAIGGQNSHSSNPASEHSGMFLFSFSGLPAAEGFNSSAVSAYWNFGAFGAEAGVQRTGDEIASMHRMYAGISHRVQNSSVGFRFNLGQFRAEGISAVYNVSVAAGGITRLSAHTSAGVWIDNFSIGREEESGLFGVRMQAGLITEISENLMVSASVLHQLNELPLIKSGFEYKINRNTAIRAGSSIFPSALFIGSGFRYWKVSIDLAGSYRRTLGTEFQITAGYTPVKKK